MRLPVALLLSLIPALLALQPARAQVPGAFVTIPAADQPVHGSGVSATMPPDDQIMWTRPPTSSSSGGVGWSFLLLADVNGDGLDDLCGLYGLSNGQHVYGCVHNNAAGFFEGPIAQAQAFNGPPTPSVHSTMALVDLDGTGPASLCGRTMEGMKCQRFNPATGTFDPPFALFPNDPQVDFSDANFWNTEPYHSTIAFTRIAGKTALCGRRSTGVICFLRNHGAFVAKAFWQPAFNDSGNWNLPQYYRTLRYVDVDGDGSADICLRGEAGVWCSFWRQVPVSRFDTPILMTSQFSDYYGWNNARYFGSIRIGDVSADGLPEICGRGGGGLYCGIDRSQAGLAHPLAGDEFKLVQTGMSDAQNWGNPTARLDSLFIVDFDGDGKNDVCGLNAPSGSGFPDLFCAKSRSTATGAVFDALVVRTRNVNTADKIVAGHLYNGGAMGFCWRLLDGSVNCSARWR